MPRLSAVGISGLQAGEDVKLHVFLATETAVMPGDKIAQLLIQPVYADTIVDCAELSGSERGELGFGSSGE